MPWQTQAHNTLRGRECVALAREVLGGNGVIYDNLVARHFVDMEGIYTFEGTYEVNILCVWALLLEPLGRLWQNAHHESDLFH